MNNPLPQHKQHVAKDFSAAADIYDNHAFLQQKILRELVAGDADDWQQKTVLDAGTGTGMLALLRPEAHLIGLDIAEGMCRRAHLAIPQMIVADMESLPLADASVQGVLSSLALQWLEQPECFYAEALRVCKPAGWLRVATLMPQTLTELRNAYLHAGLTPPVLDFHAGVSVVEQAEEAGWQVVKYQQQCLVTQHSSVRALLHYLKNLGARHKQGRGIKTPAHLKALEECYVRSSDGRNSAISASWHLAMLWARKPK